MDRDLTLEKHLLSRSFDSESQIVTLLQERYSIFGGQKPYIALTPTEGEEPVKSETAKTRLGRSGPSSRRKKSTRAELKRYIKSTLAKQKRAVRTVQGLPTSAIEGYIMKLEIPKYKEYEQLHTLWCRYMTDLLFGENKTPNMNMILPKLSTADYNGCLVRVLESRNHTMVGIEGIVLYDAQHSFIVVVPQKADTGEGPAVSAAERVGGLRVLAKKGSLFAFEVPRENGESMGFTIMGSRFEHRSTDRSGRKFKSHNVDDII